MAVQKFPKSSMACMPAFGLRPLVRLRDFVSLASPMARKQTRGLQFTHIISKSDIRDITIEAALIVWSQSSFSGHIQPNLSDRIHKHHIALSK